MKKILVIDDDLGITDAIRIILEDNNYLVNVVSESEMAMENIRLIKPDLILLDIRMPGLSGEEICRTIKNDPNFAKIPVIMLSASTQTDQKSLEVGADDFIFKPFDMDELIKKVAYFVELKSKVEAD